MTKKEYIIQFLEYLESWSINQNMIEIVKKIENEEALDRFFEIVKNIVLTINNEEIENKYIEMIENIKILEGEDIKIEQSELDELEEILF